MSKEYNRKEGANVKKVYAAMSGGVDSSVAAFLLKNQGYTCKGITLRLYDGNDTAVFESRNCGSDEDITDAKKVCDTLGISHSVINMEDRFKSCVMQNFADVYFSGGVPNPCVVCNKHIKFNGVLDEALKDGFDYIATGHYCSIEKTESGRYILKKAVDSSKDQTYMLYSLSQNVLSRVLFPLGGLSKAKVREIAEENGLINARKKDSQDICFIKDGDYRSFLQRFTGHRSESGDFVLPDGSVIGKHSGIEGYTVGQRKGLGISYEHPLYVIEKNLENNTVTVGKEELLFSARVTVNDVNFLPFEKLTRPIKATAKLRYSQKESECTIHPIGENQVILEFTQPQRAVTKGQSAVFYDGEYCIGGGIIG